MKPLRARSTSKLRRVAILLAGSLVAIAAAPFVCSGAEPVRLLRAIVPADRPEAWPSGDWERVPYQEFVEFERSGLERAASAGPPPLIEQLVFRGALVEPTIVAGRFEARVRRLDESNEFLALGEVTPAVSDVEWSDGAAVWGTAPDGSLLLQVDRAEGVLTGNWSLRGESIFDEIELDLRIFPAAVVRLELALPDGLALQCSRGIVFPPDPSAGVERRWTVELGQAAECVCRLIAAAGASPAGPTCDRIASYAIRNDGCHLQTDFSISLPPGHSSNLRFVVPDELENLEVTTAANSGLSFEFEEGAEGRILIVPLPRGIAGRLAALRVSGDVAVREDEDWVLPDAQLEGATTVSGLHRLRVDRPLTLLSFEPRGMRQTGISFEEGSGTWSFEDLARDAGLKVRVGRTASDLSLRALTLLDRSQAEVRFRTAVSIASRGDSVFHAELRLPADCRVIDVTGLPGEPSPATSWRVDESGAEVRLTIEFRQAVSSQRPGQVVVTGRCLGRDRGAQEIRFFPHLSGPETDSQVVLAVRGEESAEASSYMPNGSARMLPSGETASAWTNLADVLAVPVHDASYAWFIDSDSRARGTISVSSVTPRAGSDEGAITVGGESEPASSAPLQLDLQLESSIGNRGAQWHRHHAVFLLSGRRPQSPPRIRLPAGTMLDGIVVDGEPQNVVSADDTIEMLDWRDTASRVEIRYRSRDEESAGWFGRELTIPLPEWEAPVHELAWRLSLPRTESLSDVQSPWSTFAPREEPDWTERLFGPLARADWSATLNPLSARPQAVAGESDSAVTLGILSPGASLVLRTTEIPNVQRTGWLCLFGACVVFSLLRHRTSWGRAAASLMAAGLLVAALVFPNVAAVLCGSALMGTLLAILLPESWLTSGAARVMRWEASTVHRAGAAAGACLLFAGLMTSGVLAQAPVNSEPPVEPTPGSEPPPQFDVLIPTMGNEPGTDVWIRRSLYRQMESWRSSRRRDPAWLLRSARYSFRQGAVPQLSAAFSVAVFGDARRELLALPFGRLWVADPDACRVNGEPAQIRPSGDSRSLLVALEDLPPADGDVRAVTVTLDLQPSIAARKGAGWEFDVPPVLDAELTLPASDDSPNELSTRSQRKVETGEEGERFAIGSTQTVSLQPVTTDDSGPSNAGWVVDALSLVEVHPLRLRIRTQLTSGSRRPAAVWQGSRRIRLMLPERADVREVTVAGLRSYSVRQPRPDTTLLEVELERELAADAVLHLDFTLPVQDPASRPVIPSLLFLENGQLRSHWMGLRAAPGIELDPPPATGLPPNLQEMPFTEVFSAGLSDDTEWPVPSHVYRVAAPVAFAVDMAPIQPLRSASVEQSIRVGDGTVQWQATAVIDVAVAPVYRHEFTLAPGMRLDSVAVTQSDVSQLLGWARRDDRLVLYLPGDRTGRQEVRLTGVMPFDVSAATTPFPEFGVLDARITGAELIIQSPQARRLDLFAADGSAVSTGTATATDAGFIRRFSQQDAALPVAFRSEPVPKPLSVLIASSIKRDDDGWRLTTEFIPDRPMSEREFLVVGMPGTIAESALPNPSTTLTAEGKAGEAVRLLLQKRTDAADTVLGFSVPLVVPEQGEWTAPRIELLHTAVSDQLVVLPDDFPFVPAGSAASILEPESRPEFVVQLEASRGDVSVYRWVEPEARFAERVTADGTPIVHLVDSVVWLGEDGSTAGLSNFWLTAESSQVALRLPWPGRVQLQRVLWDDEALDAVPEVDETLLCRVNGLAARSIHRLRLEWHTPAGSMDANVDECWRPRWGQTSTAREIAVVLRGDGSYLWPTGSLRTRADVLETRADALLDLAEAATADADRIRLRRAIESTLMALAESPSTTSDPLRARWGQLQASATAANATEADFPGSLEPQVDVESAALRDESALLMPVPPGAAGIRIRQFHRGLALAAAGLVVLLAVVLLSRLGRTWSRVVSRSPVDLDALGVALLGVLWWLWLQVSLIGVALLVVAAALQWRTRRSPSVSEMAAEL